MTFGVLKRNIYKECFTQYKYEKHNKTNPNKIIDVERVAPISAWKMERDNGRLFGTSETRFNAGVCEMTELKTLKDLVNEKEVSKGDAYTLKQEAIKWIKDLNNETCEACKEQGERTYGWCETCDKAHVGLNKDDISEWIKHFFNITEEDLK